MNYVISLLLFLIALGVLVTIHELGHFIAAKSFNIYCSDFSIGFGWKIVKYKRKNGETTFSLGIIPFGGYVSMAGEEVDDSTKDETNPSDLPKERTLEGISRWKKIIIFSAGVIMNFVLAYLIFFVSAVSSPQLVSDPYLDIVSIVDETNFDNHVTNINGDILTMEEKEFVHQSIFPFNSYQYDYTYRDSNNQEITKTVQFQNIALIGNTYLNNEKNVFVTSFDTLNFGYNDTDYSNLLKFYKAFSTENIPEEVSNIKIMDQGEWIDLDYVDSHYYLPYVDSSLKIKEVELEQNDVLTFDTGLLKVDENQEIEALPVKISIDVLENKKFSHIGLGMYTDFRWLGWDAFAFAGKKWVDSCTAISDALAQLFYNANSWQNLGGPVAIFTQTTQILTNYPFSFYLETWGLISVNLALFNLLPFPGLDGWQILVELIEGSVNTVKKSLHKAKKVVKKEDENEVKTEALSNENTSTVISENSNENIEVIDGENNQEVDILNNEENTENNDKNDKNNDYKEWRIPPKVKNIVSTIGLIILFAFMFLILIKDIVGLF